MFPLLDFNQQEQENFLASVYNQGMLAQRNGYEIQSCPYRNCKAELFWLFGFMEESVQ